MLNIEDNLPDKGQKRRWFRIYATNAKEKTFFVKYFFVIPALEPIINKNLQFIMFEAIWSV